MSLHFEVIVKQTFPTLAKFRFPRISFSYSTFNAVSKKKVIDNNRVN